MSTRCIKYQVLANVFDLYATIRRNLKNHCHAIAALMDAGKSADSATPRTETVVSGLVAHRPLTRVFSAGGPRGLWGKRVSCTPGSPSSAATRCPPGRYRTWGSSLSRTSPGSVCPCPLARTSSTLCVGNKCLCYNVRRYNRGGGGVGGGDGRRARAAATTAAPSSSSVKSVYSFIEFAFV